MLGREVCPKRKKCFCRRGTSQPAKDTLGVREAGVMAPGAGKGGATQANFSSSLLAVRYLLLPLRSESPAPSRP